MSIPGSIENGSIDTEFTPILHAIDGKYCAADERFASVNEAIGLLEYKLEQHIAGCADISAQAADAITDIWGAIGEVCDRLAALEAAQPIPQIQRLPDGDALTAAYMVGREDGKRSRPTMDSEGVTLSHDAYDELERQAAKWRSVPWVALCECVYAAGRDSVAKDDSNKAQEWLDANAPKEAGE